MTTTLLAAVVLWSAAAPIGDPRPPSATAVAVMPFKNLNDDKELAWLSLGIAETTIADLRSGGRVVVERDQLDKALAEIALQGEKLNEDSRAAKAGRLVGASRVLLGGYQRAGNELRITARLVDVETGVVQDTAKVTGPMASVFSLQDDLVGALLKLPKKAPRKRPKNPETVLIAYQAYSQSLSTSSQAEKVDLLRRALDIDPEFTYALADLRALQARLDSYAKRTSDLLDQKSREQLAIALDDGKPVQERNLAAVQSMSALMQVYRWQALLDLATRLYEAKLPDDGMVHGRQFAAYSIFLALQTLKKSDMALQAGERFLQEYPGSAYAQGVQVQMRVAIEARHRTEENKKRAQKDLAADEFERSQKEKEGRLTPLLVRNWDFRRCSTLMSGELFVEAVAACREFADDYRASNDDDNLVKLSRWMLARAYVELGDFKAGDDEAKRLIEEYPTWAREMSVDTVRSMWPKP